MNFLQICQDYRIAIAPTGHKHQRRGWVNVECPFCTGNPGFHLGYEQSSGGSGFACFRCGGHSGISTIAALLGVTSENAREIIENYGGKAYYAMLPRKREYKLQTNVVLPPCGPLNKLGIDYLSKRNFDPDKLVRLYDLKQTGPIGRFRHRIVIPIKYHGYNISYTARSCVGSEVRYISCSADLECIPHKDVLYAIDETPGRNRLVILEGCPNVWRMGPGSVATFGTKVSAAQLKLMTAFRRVVLFRDLDDAGLAAWSEVAARLRFAGSRLDIVAPDGVPDAAELSQVEADYLMKIL